MNRASVSAFAARAATTRRAVFGTAATYDGRPLCVARTSLAHRRQIEAGGFEFTPEAVVRVERAAYPWFLPTEAAAKAAVGQTFTLSDQPLKIVEARLLDAEVLLTLGKV